MDKDLREAALAAFKKSALGQQAAAGAETGESDSPQEERPDSAVAAPDPSGEATQPVPGPASPRPAPAPRAASVSSRPRVSRTVGAKVGAAASGKGVSSPRHVVELCLGRVFLVQQGGYKSANEREPV